MFIFLGILIALWSGWVHYIYDNYHNPLKGWQQYMFYPSCVILGLLIIVEFFQFVKILTVWIQHI